MSFIISDAMAQNAPAQGEFWGTLLFPIFLIVIFYFLMIRPQTRRAKEHKQMVEALKKGDEVVTGGGVLGRVAEVGENFVLVEVTDGIQLKVQKNSIASLMPKGTIKGDL